MKLLKQIEFDIPEKIIDAVLMAYLKQQLTYNGLELLQKRAFSLQLACDLEHTHAACEDNKKGVSDTNV